MEFTDEELKRMIQGTAVGNIYPYNTEDEELIEEYIKKVVYQFRRIHTMHSHFEFDHYGSGYSSYIDVSCWLKDQSSVIERVHNKDGFSEITEMNRLSIYISRLAPVAIMGKSFGIQYIWDETNSNEVNIGGSPLSLRDISTEPDDFMADEVKEVTRYLKESGYTFLDKEYLEQPLNFQTVINTIFTTPQEGYKVFDALFYWLD